DRRRAARTHAILVAERARRAVGVRETVHAPVVLFIAKLTRTRIAAADARAPAARIRLRAEQVIIAERTVLYSSQGVAVAFRTGRIT
ncbi:unnamed protein product, partial [marine sediment metagenome]